MLRPFRCVFASPIRSRNKITNRTSFDRTYEYSLDKLKNRSILELLHTLPELQICILIRQFSNLFNLFIDLSLKLFYLPF